MWTHTSFKVIPDALCNIHLLLWGTLLGRIVPQSTVRQASDGLAHSLLKGLAPVLAHGATR